MRPGVEIVTALDVQHLSYRYDNGTDALKDIRFSVGEGERVGLIGANGAGKSTLLLHLNGLLPEHRAKDPAIRVFNTPVMEPNLNVIRSQVGLLFQDPDDQLFCPTVWEDVAFGPRQLSLSQDHIKAKVSRALRMVGLTGFESEPLTDLVAARSVASVWPEYWLAMHDSWPWTSRRVILIHGVGGS